MSLRQSPGCRRVILVEDDAPLADALRFVLTAEGFSVDAFRDAESLLAEIDDRAAVCIVLDQKLGPGMSGLLALEYLRHLGYRWPAILMTTNPAQWLIDRATAANAEVVEKPILGDRLLDYVRRAAASAPSAT